MLSWEDYEHIY